MYDEREDFYQKIGAEKVDVTEMKDSAVVKKIFEVTKDGK